MKKMLIILIFTFVSVAGCKKHDVDIPNYGYLVVEDIYVPSWEGKSWINFTSDYETQKDLEVEPTEYCDWVSDFDVRYSRIYVCVDSNKTGKDRECLFLAHSDKTGEEDTFRITQYKEYDSSEYDGGASGGSSSTISNRRCAAYTKKGARCKRRAAAGSAYCWQHKK